MTLKLLKFQLCWELHTRPLFWVSLCWMHYAECIMLSVIMLKVVEPDEDIAVFLSWLLYLNWSAQLFAHLIQEVSEEYGLKEMQPPFPGMEVYRWEKKIETIIASWDCIIWWIFFSWLYFFCIKTYLKITSISNPILSDPILTQLNLN
jgi:hypothetical protein